MARCGGSRCRSSQYAAIPKGVTGGWGGGGGAQYTTLKITIRAPTATATNHNFRIHHYSNIYMAFHLYPVTQSRIKYNRIFLSKFLCLLLYKNYTIIKIVSHLFSRKCKNFVSTTDWCDPLFRICLLTVFRISCSIKYLHFSILTKEGSIGLGG